MIKVRENEKQIDYEYLTKLYTEWKRLEKLTEEAENKFQIAHYNWIESTVDNMVETRTKSRETKEQYLELKEKTHDAYKKYRTA